jgi:2,3-bisphosphoglycerate-independent phosphoglycerate mutase
MKQYDLVVLHVGAVNEACHEANPAAKIAAIEAVDAGLLEPLLKGLEKVDQWRMMITTDHITPTQELSRIRGPVPVAFCGHEVEGIRHYAFSEANAEKSDLFVDKGHNLMEFFLGIKRK